jgi:histidine phosphotransferase ChpT
MQIDLKVAQLLSSRLCHDLVGPIGAVNTGLELMEEDSDDDGAALGLMARSAAEAIRRLAFFRMAFGLGGAGGGAALNEARALAEGYLESGKVTLDWPDHADVSLGPVPPGAVKVVLNMILMAAESLPRGGVAELSLNRLDEGLGVGLTASGEGAALRKDLADALAQDGAAAGNALSARNVHAYLAQCMARDLGARIEHSEGLSGEIQLAVLFPNTADC